MAEHGNRSERHEAEIRKFVDTHHLEYNLEEEHLHDAVEKFNESNPNEKRQAKAFEPKKD